jgi:fluoroquinolone transport system ATP-binding protein
MITVDDLRYTYPGAAGPTLGGIGFAVAAGEVYGLLGPSGAGKSTTQRILMRLLRGYTGRVEVFDQPVAALGRDLYERIGVSFELPALYLRLSALENLKLFTAFYGKPCRDPMAVLAEVELEDAANQRVEHFSKGMRMRLNLARSILHDPDLLFLDEPTTGQDPARARRIRDLILRLKASGKTVFLTTHNMSEAAEVCDRVGFLAGGTIHVSGAPADLMRQFGRRELDVTIRQPVGMQTRVFAMDGLAANSEFQELLTAGQIVSMHTREASLDDVFIAATGASGRPS